MMVNIPVLTCTPCRHSVSRPGHRVAATRTIRCRRCSGGKGGGAKRDAAEACAVNGGDIGRSG